MRLNLSKHLRHCQEETANIYDGNKLHPLLIGEFEPDIRPFEWPQRKQRETGPRPVQPNLFEDNTYDKTDDLDW